MELLLNEQQSLLAEMAARLCADFGGAKRARELKTSGVEMDRDAWRAVLKAGWLSTVVAEHHGGLGLGAFDLALTVEEAGKRLLMVPLVEAAAVAWTLSRAAGSAKAPLLSDLRAGTRLIVPAIEASFWRYGGGVENGGLRFDDTSSALTGAIPFVAYGRSADAFLVGAEYGSETLLCIVPKHAAGVSVTPRVNVDGSTASMLRCERAGVLPENVVARGAAALTLARQMQEFLVLGLSVELIGLASAALNVTLDYIKMRQQFGRPIGSFQVLQHRAVDGFIDIELDRSLAYRVLAAFDAGEHHPAMVCAAKARASRSALEIVRGALQMHGAIGYTEEHDIGLYYKRAIALAARYGNELSHASRFSSLTLCDTPRSLQQGALA